MSKSIVALAFAAGLLGGAASRYLAPQPVHADSGGREVRAQSFVLINDHGNVLGTFSAEAGRSVLKLYDGTGREIWSVGGKTAVPSTVLGK